MVLLHKKHHRRAYDRLLRDPLHARLPGHAESEFGKSVQGELGLSRRRVHGIGKEEHDRLRDGGNGGPTIGRRYADVENSPVKRSTDHTDPVHGLLERSYGIEEAVHAVAHRWRVSEQRQHAVVHILLPRGAHGSHGRARGTLASFDRGLVHHVHGCFQLYRGYHVRRIEDAKNRCR